MAEEQTGGMIALVPSDPAALAVPGGDPADEMHLTLAFLGDDVTQVPEETWDRLADELAEFAAGQRPVSGRIFAHAVWNVDGGPDGKFDPATVYELEGPDFDALRSHVAFTLAPGALGRGAMPPQFVPFKPHVTAGYGVPPGNLTAMGTVTFDKIRLATAGAVRDIPLGRTDEEEAPVGTYDSGALTADAKADALTIDSEVPVDFPVIIVEGMDTADGRFIEPGALGHRALPLPILAQTRNPDGGDGHAGAEVIGRLDELERLPGPEVTSKETGEPFPEGTFVWSGRGVVDASTDGGRLAQQGYLTGNSADLSEVDVEFIMPEPEEGEEDEENIMAMFAEPEQIRLSSGKIAATTLVPVPAFAESYVQIDGAEPERPDDAEEDVVVAAAWTSAEIGDECAPCAASGPDGLFVSQEKRDRAEEEGHAMEGGRYPIENREDLDNAIQAVGRAGGPDGDEEDRQEVRRHIMRQAERLDAEDAIPETWNSDGTLKEDGENSDGGLTAAAQMFPPISAFTDPGLEEPTALTLVEQDGYTEVYAHLATWGTCHTSFSGQCVTPPRSNTDYSYFNVGAARALDGEQVRTVAVGHITMGPGGHASMRANAQEAAAHYDNVNTVVADVAAGEDAHGIWVHGVIRRGVTEAELETLRSSPLSGDWRKVGSSLELVAALAVNVPGFPVPRARVAAGAPESLVAAGAVPPARNKVRVLSAREREEQAEEIAELVARKLQERDQLEQQEYLSKQQMMQLRARRAKASLEL